RGQTESQTEAGKIRVLLKFWPDTPPTKRARLRWRETGPRAVEREKAARMGRYSSIRRKIITEPFGLRLNGWIGPTRPFVTICCDGRVWPKADIDHANFARSSC